MKKASQQAVDLSLWQKPIDAFVLQLEKQKNYSHHTQEQYRRQLLEAAKFFAEHVSSWFQLNATHIRQYSHKLNSQQFNARTISLKLSCIRSFFRFLQSEQIKHQQDMAKRQDGDSFTLPDKEISNPAEAIKGPKFSPPLPKNLDVDQVERLLDINDDDPLAIRDVAMMELMYSSGLRISELVAANINDFTPNKDEIRVVEGKGNKERIVPVGKKARDALNKWCSVRGEFIGDDPVALFLSKKKNRISIRQVRLRMKQWGIKQGIDATVHPHKLRHSFASHILESSSDLRAVQELLGHASLSATQVYTHLDFQHLAKVYDKAHPRAKKQK